MKRSYSDMATTLSVLPPMNSGEPSVFKSTLTGTYKLRVTKVADISKPADNPVDEIEEPEEDEKALENKLNKSNARMIQLDLKDSNSTNIKAIETEFIELLSNVKPNCTISILGPVDIRCRNIMLEKKHVVSVEAAPKEEAGQAPSETKQVPIIQEQAPKETQYVPIIQEQAPRETQYAPSVQEQVSEDVQFIREQAPKETKPHVQVIEIGEDWDEDDDDYDCITLD